MNNINWIDCDLFFYQEDAQYFMEDEIEYERYVDELYEDALRFFGKEKMDKYFNSINFKDPEYNSFNDKYNDWEFLNPIYIKYDEKKERLKKEFDEKELARVMLIESFVGNGFSIPGTLIQLESGEEYLIGHSTTEGVLSGTDYCNTMIPRNIKIKKYAVIYNT